MLDVQPERYALGRVKRNVDANAIVQRMIAKRRREQHVNPDEIQSQITKQVFFRYNSVNLVLGKRGSGKTYAVLTEIMKLPVLDCSEFKQIFYITTKLHDDTVEFFRPLIDSVGMKFTWVDTRDALATIESLEMLKQILSEPEFLRANPEDADQLANTMGYESYEEMQELLDGRLPHTIIMFDDCIGLFKKESALGAKLFQNRQSRITYFLMLQDITGISSSIKGNIDSLMLFGKFSPQKIRVLKQHIAETGFTYEQYTELDEKDYVWLDFKTNNFAIYKRQSEDTTNGHVEISESSGISNGTRWQQYEKKVSYQKVFPSRPTITEPDTEPDTTEPDTNPDTDTTEPDTNPDADVD